jgi:hypothetical protein
LADAEEVTATASKAAAAGAQGQPAAAKPPARGVSPRWP